MMLARVDQNFAYTAALQLLVDKIFLDKIGSRSYDRANLHRQLPRTSRISFVIFDICPGFQRAMRVSMLLFKPMATWPLRAAPPNSLDCLGPRGGWIRRRKPGSSLPPSTAIFTRNAPGSQLTLSKTAERRFWNQATACAAVENQTPLLFSSSIRSRKNWPHSLSGAMLRSCQLTVTLPPNWTALSMMLLTRFLASLGDRLRRFG